MKTIYLLTADNHGDLDSFIKIKEQVKKDYADCNIKIFNLGDYNDHWGFGYFSKDGKEYVDGSEAIDGNHYLIKSCLGMVQDIDEELKNIPDIKARSRRYHEKYTHILPREKIINEFCQYRTIVADNGTKILLLHAPIYDLEPYDIYSAYDLSSEETRQMHMKVVNSIIEKENPDYVVGGHRHDNYNYDIGDKDNWYNIRINIIGTASTFAPRDSKTKDINYAIIDENGKLTNKLL